MTKPRYSNKRYTPRVYIADALSANPRWLTAQQIADILCERRRSRRILNGPNSISNLLRGARGVERDDSGRVMRYRMNDRDAFITWARGEKHIRDNKWHGRV